MSAITLSKLIERLQELEEMFGSDLLVEFLVDIESDKKLWVSGATCFTYENGRTIALLPTDKNDDAALSKQGTDEFDSSPN